MEATILETQAALAAGTITSEELVKMYVARIDAFDKTGPAINAMIRLNAHALAEARALDAERHAKGARGPLHGIPILLKDNYDTFDMPTSAASLSLATSIPPDDGTWCGDCAKPVRFSSARPTCTNSPLVSRLSARWEDRR